MVSLLVLLYYYCFLLLCKGIFPFLFCIFITSLLECNEIRDAVFFHGENETSLLHKKWRMLCFLLSNSFFSMYRRSTVCFFSPFHTYWVVWICAFQIHTHFLLSSAQAINLSAFCRISIIWPSIIKILPAGTRGEKRCPQSFWTLKGLTANTCNVSVTSWVLLVWHWAQHTEWIIVYAMRGVGEKEGLAFA